MSARTGERSGIITRERHKQSRYMNSQRDPVVKGSVEGKLRQIHMEVRRSAGQRDRTAMICSE